MPSKLFMRTLPAERGIELHCAAGARREKTEWYKTCKEKCVVGVEARGAKKEIERVFDVGIERGAFG